MTKSVCSVYIIHPIKLCVCTCKDMTDFWTVEMETEDWFGYNGRWNTQESLYCYGIGQ